MALRLKKKTYPKDNKDNLQSNAFISISLTQHFLTVRPHKMLLSKEVADTF